jgi:hypothetical protein
MIMIPELDLISEECQLCYEPATENVPMTIEDNRFGQPVLVTVDVSLCEVHALEERRPE